MRRIVKLVLRLNRVVDRYLPSALGIAVLLTVLTFVLSCAFGFDEVAPLHRPLRAALAWGQGLSGLLAFAMQMCLVMLTGFIVAQSPLFRRALDALARVPRTPRQTVAWMAFLSMTLGLLNWGISIVGSAVLVRAMARRRPGVDYRLLVASAYLGLGCTWHAGLSASAPMTVAATKNDFISGGYLAAPVAFSETIGSGFNLGLVAIVLVVMTLLAAFLHPDEGEVVTVDPSQLTEASELQVTNAGFWDRSWLLPWGIALAAGVYVAISVRESGFRALDINLINIAFLALGLSLHGSLRSFTAAATQGASYLHGIVIQFPLYAGMGALIKTSGLAQRVADMLVAHASREQLPLLVYWYSGIVNYFVPSGGSKFAIEAPYLFPAAERLAVEPSTMVLAYAWGDMMTDIIQPFWAIPLLAMAGLDFRSIAGFCAVLFLAYATIVSVAFGVMF